VRVESESEKSEKSEKSESEREKVMDPSPKQNASSGIFHTDPLPPPTAPTLAGHKLCVEKEMQPRKKFRNTI